MKKIIIGMFALTLISSTSAFADSVKKVKKVKSKVVCTKGCPETKDCHNTAKCPKKPGCVCD